MSLQEFPKSAAITSVLVNSCMIMLPKTFLESQTRRLGEEQSKETNTLHIEIKGIIFELFFVPLKNLSDHRSQMVEVLLSLSSPLNTNQLPVIYSILNPLAQGNTILIKELFEMLCTQFSEVSAVGQNDYIRRVRSSRQWGGPKLPFYATDHQQHKTNRPPKTQQRTPPGFVRKQPHSANMTTLKTSSGNPPPPHIGYPESVISRKCHCKETMHPNHPWININHNQCLSQSANYTYQPPMTPWQQYPQCTPPASAKQPGDVHFNIFSGFNTPQYWPYVNNYQPSESNVCGDLENHARQGSSIGSSITRNPAANYGNRNAPATFTPMTGSMPYQKSQEVPNFSDKFYRPWTLNTQANQVGMPRMMNNGMHYSAVKDPPSYRESCMFKNEQPPKNQNNYLTTFGNGKQQKNNYFTLPTINPTFDPRGMFKNEQPPKHQSNYSTNFENGQQQKNNCFTLPTFTSTLDTRGMFKNEQPPKHQNNYSTTFGNGQQQKNNGVTLPKFSSTLEPRGVPFTLSPMAGSWIEGGRSDKRNNEIQSCPNEDWDDSLSDDSTTSGRLVIDETAAVNLQPGPSADFMDDRSYFVVDPNIEVNEEVVETTWDPVKIIEADLPAEVLEFIKTQETEKFNKNT